MTELESFYADYFISRDDVAIGSEFIPMLRLWV